MFQRLKDHQRGFSSSMGLPLQRLIAESPLKFMAEKFAAFPAGNQFCDLWRQ
jgi:hypothetical protein